MKRDCDWCLLVLMACGNASEDVCSYRVDDKVWQAKLEMPHVRSRDAQPRREATRHCVRRNGGDGGGGGGVAGGWGRGCAARC
jgi:hypothetical protein